MEYVVCFEFICVLWEKNTAKQENATKHKRNSSKKKKRKEKKHKFNWPDFKLSAFLLNILLSGRS